MDLYNKARILNNPKYDPYDKMGRGMDYDKALLWEAMANLLPFGQEGNLNPVYSRQLIQEGLYPVRPEFVSQDYRGSGTFIEEGDGKNNILLNETRPFMEMIQEIIPHELRHKQSGGLGGITEYTNKKLEDWLDYIGEEEYRRPQERFAYGGDNVMLNKIHYYLPGDLRRHLESYE